MSQSYAKCIIKHLNKRHVDGCGHRAHAYVCAPERACVLLLHNDVHAKNAYYWKTSRCSRLTLLDKRSVLHLAYFSIPTSGIEAATPCNVKKCLGKYQSISIKNSSSLCGCVLKKSQSGKSGVKKGVSSSNWNRNCTHFQSIFRPLSVSRLDRKQLRT